ncbi:GNAT family N-acetyltransferase [Pseudomonadota bacterium]
MTITYKTDCQLTADEYIDILKRSSLGRRRPVEDYVCMDGMVKNSNLLVSAWNDKLLVGVARSVTDFHYACYMSDLAVDEDYQKQGIGKELIKHSQKKLGPKCKIRLISAPDATAYYPKIGFTKNENCWQLTGG